MKPDRALKQAVSDQLRWDPSIDEAHIGISACDGVVTLSGHVETYGEKLAAERAAKRVPGVLAVADELEVRRSGAHVRSDADLAAVCLAVLRGLGTTRTEGIVITVANAWVWLDGHIDADGARPAIEAALRAVPGIRGVTDNLMVEPRAATAVDAREADLDATG